MRGMGPDALVYLGIKGTVMALDRRTGVVIWQTRLKGWNFVNVVLDGDAVLATTQGEIYCLDALSGQVRWNNPLTGMGFGLVTVAGAGISSSLVPFAQAHAQQAQAQSGAVPAGSS
jgi:outer membrane protein assembly factor BamB